MDFFNSMGPGRWPGQNWKGTQSHNLLFLLNVTGSSLEATGDFAQSWRQYDVYFWLFLVIQRFNVPSQGRRKRLKIKRFL